jgi:hypothetical protein
MKTYMVKQAFIFFIFYFYVFSVFILYNKNKVFMWCWNISGQVRLISGPRFCHLGVAESASQRLIMGRNGQVQTDTLTDQVN